MHYPTVDDVTDVLKLAIQVQKGTYEPPSSNSSSSSAAVVVGRSSEQKAAPAAAPAARPNWLASASSTRDHSDAVYASVFTHPQ